MAVNIRVKVHPVVLFQIADAYERRDMEKFRVIGTLLGKSEHIFKFGGLYAYAAHETLLRYNIFVWCDFVNFRLSR